MPLSLWLVPFGVLGALDALYFVLVTYGWMKPDASIVPRVCRMDEKSCASIVHTRWGRVLGLPNAVYGLAWYLLILVLGVTGIPAAWCLPLLVASAGTVALSILLFWALIWRLKVPCPLCFLGHALNVAIFGVLLWVCL